MGEVVNLRMVRKAKGRLASEAKADQNRLRFGQGKSEKLRTTAELRKLNRLLDGGKLDTPPVKTEV
jgi:Domain of unknown function (DUF4169)